MRIFNNMFNGNNEKEDSSKEGFFKKLTSGLNKTKQNIVGGIDNVLKNFTKIDEELLEELEETLITSDIGIKTTMDIIDKLRENIKENRIKSPEDIKIILKQELIGMIENNSVEDVDAKIPEVIFVIGVNGAGKTTTIGKLAARYKEKNKKVVLAAADTFRAAAIEQLEEWAKRTSVDLIKHKEGSDPGAVVFDAVNAAKARKADVLICDTAGRLHNKKNLMNELSKMNKIIDKEYGEARKKTILVLDATTGQNALQQARMFGENINIDGIILTKLDGTAKGGIVIAIQNELSIPVLYIGVGEGIDDMQKFNSKEFIDALFD